MIPKALSQAFLSISYRWTEILIIIMAIPLFGIGATAYQRGEKWSWYTLLAMRIIGWFGSAAIQTTYPTLFAAYLDTIGIILFLIAIILPAKAILSKQ